MAKSTLPVTSPPHKGTFTPQICPPGPALGDWIERCARHDGLPIFRVVDGLSIPALTWTGDWHHFDREPAARGVRPAVAAHLEAERDGAKRVADAKRDRLQLARLSAAAFRDIGGNALTDIAEHLGYAEGVEWNSARRTLGKDIAAGRALWVCIGAWPWWGIARATGCPSLAGGMPASWWELPQVVEALAVWRAGR